MMIKSLLAVIFILLVATGNVFALTTIPLQCSNSLPDGNDYATVTTELLPGACSDYDGVKITVAPNKSVLIPTEDNHEIQNYGIQKFGFNYNGNAEALDVTTYEDDGVTVEDNWKIKYSQNVSEFGVFVELLQGTGKHRHDPYILDICKTGTDLTEADFNVQNALGNNFVVHIADFYFNDTYYETDSAYFAECPTDTDADGIYDDGDMSGAAGDNPCTAGNTVFCDDNCLNTANPNQEDVDTDGIGDACDSDTVYGTISGDVQEGIYIDIYAWSCGTAQLVDTVTTGLDGYYAIGNLDNGLYGVRPLEDGYSFNPTVIFPQIPQTVIQPYDITATEIP